MTKELKTGALYIRVSTSEQTELSPDAQKRLLLDYAKKNQIVISNEYIFVESVSGRYAEKRPQFQKMIATAKQPSHPIDVILVWKFSRFARNQEESIVYKSMLKKDGVDVISISEPLIEGPFGTLIERIIEWMDEYYSIRLSGEVNRGMREKALKHGYQSTPCLGYDSVGGGRPFVINEEEFKIVSYITHLYDDEQKDPTRIARMCNDLGFRTKRGNPFERRSIDYILRNPFYYGQVIWNGIEFEGAHEVRYTKEQYDARIKLLDARKRPSRRRNVSVCKHWLSGLLKCSICGSTLSYTGNQSCPYFQCWKYAKGFHKTSVSISVKKAEESVFEYLDSLLEGEDFHYIYKGNNAVSSLDDCRLALLQQELSKIATKEARVKDAYENEIDTLEEYKENRRRLKLRREELLKEISELKEKEEEALPPKEDLLREIRNITELLKSPDVDYEKKGVLIRSIVDEITFDKESGQLYFDMILS